MISFSFYLLHFAVIGQQARWWDRPPANEAEWALWTLGALAGSLVLGAAGHYLVERPFMRLGRMSGPAEPAQAQAHAAP
jgi:peptidoglycan/LPS O-acetylase OafA/YrhL